MVESDLRISLAHSRSPFVPREKIQLRLASEPCSCLFCVGAQSDGFCGRDMKRFTDRYIAASEREPESLRYIVGVNMLQPSFACIGENDAITSGERIKHSRIEVPRRIDWNPPRSRDVSRVKHRHREALGRCVEEEALDLSFANSIFAERLARR